MTRPTSPNINYFWAELIVEELIRHGIDTFCVSPGSRSSALTMAAANHPKAKCLVHFDERGSSFRALGIVSGSGRPCVIITTSGTAAANLFPAIIEASKKKVPLIVLTADRPPELRWTGAHQTIDQNKIFGEYVRWFFDLPCPTEAIAPAFVLTTIDQAVARAKGSPGGPVHLNCMMREPLAPVKTRFSAQHYGRPIRSWQNGSRVYTHYTPTELQLDSKTASNIVTRIKAIRNGLIVVGKLKSDSERKAVLSLAQKLNWPVFADIASGLRFGHPRGPIIHYFDQMLHADKFVKSLDVDGVIHLGGRITSKRWYQFAESADPQQYLMVLNHPLRNDPLHKVTMRIQCPVDQFCKTMVKKIVPRKSTVLLSKTQALNAKAHATFDAFFKNQSVLSEPHIARLITSLAPKDSGLFIASSMPVRDCDAFGTSCGQPVEIGANRGASGIDGTIATAVGFAESRQAPTTLLIGDLAFLHDLNSLPMTRDLKHPMIIVVINNNGGGIFSFLPIHSQNGKFEKYFGTPHHLEFQAAGDLFGLNYVRVKSPDQLSKSYGLAGQGRTSTIIEIQTDRQENLKIHQQLESSIKRAIDGHSHQSRARNHHVKEHSPIRTTDALEQLGELHGHQVR